MAELMDKIFVVIGYILAILFPIVGIIVGALLYFLKKEDAFYQTHGKYIIIVGIAMIAINILLIAFGIITIPLVGQV